MNKKKHHYIPKFILKNFSVKQSIFTYRHDTKEIFKVSIEDAFAINNLNTLFDKNKFKHSNLIEDIYDKRFESSASLTIQKIINDLQNVTPTGKDFLTEDFIILLRFAILSSHRTPYAIDAIHHAIRVSAYSAISLKYFLDFGKLEFPYDLAIEKGMLYSFLDNFDEFTKLIADLKLTIYYHRLPDKFFLIPDQYVIISSPNNIKYADKELKMYFPVSSNIVVCLERIQRNFTKATCEIDKEDVENFNRYFINSSFDSVGCQDHDYLKSFIQRRKNDIVPLTKFNPNKDFSQEKMQIRNEIISKLILNPEKSYFNKSIITHIDRDHKFAILTEAEYKIAMSKLNSTVNITKRIYHLK